MSNFLTSAKTLLPNKVTFADSRRTAFGAAAWPTILTMKRQVRAPQGLAHGAHQSGWKLRRSGSRSRVLRLLPGPGCSGTGTRCARLEVCWLARGTPAGSLEPDTTAQGWGLGGAWTSVDQRRQPGGSGKGNPALPAALKGRGGWAPGAAMDWAAWVRVLAGCYVVSSK